MADVVEAMSSHRPYWPALGIEAGLKEIEDGCGMLYDADAVRACVTILREKPRLSLAHPEHVTYPYLLRNLEITRANHVWAADICYIPMAKGFCYLVAIMDWASRMVLAWRLSNTLDSSFCVDALEEAISKYGCPDIFNTD